MNTKFELFKQKMNGKNVTVIGIGISNTPLIKLLCSAGARVTACDKKDCAALGKITDELSAMGVTLKTGADYLDSIDGDYIFRTPGLRPDVPALEAARQKGSVVTSEMEAFFEVCPCPIIAVTGSDGKTTTTTLISEMLKAAGYKTHIGGNIGTPLLQYADEISPNDFAVVELSSFQLFTMKKSPHIAVITNVSPNHLDIHKDMEEYVSAKENIFAWQSGADYLILNADNNYTERFKSKAKSNVILFSGTARLENGVFEQDGYIVKKSGESIDKILKTSDIFIPGRHNVENYMAAIAAVSCCNAAGGVQKVAREFKGVPHRIEFIKEINGVKYYNDSIASSPTRTIAGLRSFSKPVILIAGGYDKHIPFDGLGREIANGCVKALFLTGDTSEKIYNAVISAPEFDAEKLLVKICETLEDAVLAAKNIAENGDVITMSPACASFDRYKNFEERGNKFKAIVNSL